MSPATVIGIIGLVGYLVYFILRQLRRGKVHSNVGQAVQGSAPLSAPCRIQIFRDSSQSSEQMQQWPYAFSLNNGETQRIEDGCTIEFVTTSKSNALVGYGRSDYGGVSTLPSLDSPFVFEAVDGGLVRLAAQPTFDYSGGHGKWRSNLEQMKEP